MVGRGAVHLGEDLRLQLHQFRCGLDDEVDAVHGIRDDRCDRDAGQCAVSLFLGDFAARHSLVEARAHTFGARARCFFVDVEEADVTSSHGTNLRDAVPHGARTQYRDGVDCAHGAS